MATESEILKQQRVERAKEALQRARDLRQSRRVMGVDGIHQFVKDVDGDWLNDWTDAIDTNSTQFSKIRIQFFLFNFFVYELTQIFVFMMVLNPNEQPNTNIANNLISTRS